MKINQICNYFIYKILKGEEITNVEINIFIHQFKNIPVPPKCGTDYCNSKYHTNIVSESVDSEDHSNDTITIEEYNEKLNKALKTINDILTFHTTCFINKKFKIKNILNPSYMYHSSDFSKMINWSNTFYNLLVEMEKLQTRITEYPNWIDNKWNTLVHLQFRSYDEYDKFKLKVESVDLDILFAAMNIE